MTEEEKNRIVEGMVKRLSDKEAERRQTSEGRRKNEIVHHEFGGTEGGRARVTSEVVRDENGRSASDYLVAKDMGLKGPDGDGVVESVRKDREESGAKNPTVPANIPTNELGQPFAIFRHSKEFTEAEDVVIVNGLLAHLPLYIIADKLHCARHILSNHIKESKLLQKVWEDREESLLDHVEFQAKRLVDSGNPAMIMFWLERKGKSRGWANDNAQEVPDDDSRIVIGEIPDNIVLDAEREIAEAKAAADGKLSSLEVAQRLSSKGEVPNPMKLAIQEDEIQRMHDAEEEGEIETDVETSYSEPMDVMSDMDEFGGGGFDVGGDVWG